MYHLRYLNPQNGFILNQQEIYRVLAIILKSVVLGFNAAK
jgi:hypothetical protein